MEAVGRREATSIAAAPAAVQRRSGSFRIGDFLPLGHHITKRVAMHRAALTGKDWSPRRL